MSRIPEPNSFQIENTPWHIQMEVSLKTAKRVYRNFSACNASCTKPYSDILPLYRPAVGMRLHACIPSDEVETPQKRSPYTIWQRYTSLRVGISTQIES